MSLTYVHVSDIHFGQERGSDLYVHKDLKQRLIDDAAALKDEVGIAQMDGVIVTGDIAFSGKEDQYRAAAQWLDLLTKTIGCKATDVIVVPGNHDIDREGISAGAELMLKELVEGGNESLDRLLEDKRDREVLYAKFDAYRDFAEAYGCRLESDGGVAVDRLIPIGPERFLRFMGLNSALLCTKQGSDEGKLLLGGKQRVLPRIPGEELVVLCHHPVGSLKDAKKVSRYIKSRARVHIYGHVHNPSAEVEEAVPDGDLLTISAGATVPPNAEEGYQYTYNVLSFAWDENTDGLKIGIASRSWNAQGTVFDADTDRFDAGRCEFILRCPNFRRQAAAADLRAARDGPGGPEVVAGRPALEEPLRDAAGGNDMGETSDLLRLHFFRDLSAEQRVRALVDVGLLREDWNIELTHTIERQLLDKAVSSGLDEKLISVVGKLRGEAVTAEGSAKG